MSDLFALLDKADPWQFMAGLFVILWVVEVRFGGRAQATAQDRAKAKLEGYDMAVRHQYEAELIKAEKDGYLP